MKIISWLFGLLFSLLALAFALKNQQAVTVSLWPFGLEVPAPVYLLTLGTLFLGILIGGAVGWLGHLPHRLEARRLRKDIGQLREKIEEMQFTTTPQRRREDQIRTRPKWRFWETGS